MVVLYRLVDIGQRLRFHALRRVHHQQRAFAGSQAAAHLISEIDVARCVHQIELVGLAILGSIVEPHGLRLDGDAALFLDIHVIEHLLGHFAFGQAAAMLDQAIRQRRFAVVNMGDDGEIADARQFGHGAPLAGRR